MLNKFFLPYPPTRSQFPIETFPAVLATIICIQFSFWGVHIPHNKAILNNSIEIVFYLIYINHLYEVPMIRLNMELQINNNLGTMWTLLLVGSSFMHPLHMDI